MHVPRLILGTGLCQINRCRTRAFNALESHPEMKAGSMAKLRGAANAVDSSLVEASYSLRHSADSPTASQIAMAF